MVKKSTKRPKAARTAKKKRKAKPAKTKAVGQPGVYLYVSINRDAVRLIKAARVENTPGRNLLRPPALTREAAGRYGGQDSELVLAVVHDDDAETQLFAWSAEPETFVEDASRKAEPTQSRPLAAWEARWWIPMADSARFLQFYRSDSFPLTDRSNPYTQTSLGVFDLKPGSPDDRARRWPVPDSRPPTPVPLPGLPPSGPRRAVAARRARRAKPAKADAKARMSDDSGFVKKSTTLVDHGDPSTKFNVVILGDGFTNADLRVFDTYAALVKKALTTTKPFKGLKNRINVHKVTVVSTESGISNCPTCGTAAPRNTFFKTSGCFQGVPNAPTFIGVTSTAKIYDAVETIVPQQYAHLVVTLVNCHRYGGSTPPELRLSFLALPGPGDTNKTFMDLALHESGHIFGLCEEYNPCNQKKPSRVYPNETTQEELDTKTVKWRSLAHASELDATGQFKVIHRQGDAMAPGCQPALRAAQLKSLGAFWGCHNGEDMAPGVAQNPCDKRPGRTGRHFYRPMANCRMRNIDAGFCRVCSALVSDFIVAHSA